MECGRVEEQVLGVRSQEIGIGGVVTHSPLPHHRTCGSAYGGSVRLSWDIQQSWESERVEVSSRKSDG